MPKALLYSQDVPIPQGNDISLFRNKRDGLPYYKKWNDAIVKLTHDGDVYYIQENRVTKIINYTGEQFEVFLTDDKGLAIVFYNATHQTIVADGGGGGLGRGSVINLINEFAPSSTVTPGGDSFAPLFDYYTDETTVLATETVLYSDIVPAILDEDGKKILAIYGGEGVVGGVTYTYRVYFGGQVIASAVSASQSDWQITVTLIRSGATTARVLTSFTNAGTTQNSQTDISLLDFTIGNVLELTGQVANSAGSITAKEGYVTYMPNAQP